MPLPAASHPSPLAPPPLLLSLVPSDSWLKTKALPVWFFPGHMACALRAGTGVYSVGHPPAHLLVCAQTHTIVGTLGFGYSWLAFFFGNTEDWMDVRPPFSTSVSGGFGVLVC